MKTWLLFLMGVTLATIGGFTPGAKAAFIPTTIPDCTLWLDGSDIDGDGNPDTYTDGTAVATWVDKSGLGNNFSNADAGQPLYQSSLANNKPGLFFNGSSFLMKTGGVLPNGDYNYEFVAVWRPHIASGGQRVFEQCQPNTASRYAAILAWDSSYGFNGQNNDLHWLVPFAANEWILTDLRMDASLNPNNLSIKHNGVAYAGTTGNPGALNVGDVDCHIGSKGTGGENLNGDLMELIIYKRALSDEERNQVGFYLQEKYGFSYGYTLPGNLARMLSFNFGALGPAAISGNNISITVPYDTDVTALAPTLNVSGGATCLPDSGTTADFTSPQTYTVTSQDGTASTLYTVTVTKAPALPAGTVGYYSFNTSGNDDSGHANHLQNRTGAPQYTSGRFGGSVYVDGGSTLGPLSGGFPTGMSTGAGAYTVAFFTRVDTGCEIYGGWIGYGTPGAAGLANNFRLDGNYATIWNYWYNIDAGASLPSGDFLSGWHSVVGTWDGTTRKLYLDGVEQYSAPPTSAPNFGSDIFAVGRTLNAANFKGWMDELLIANRAFTSEEIANYNSYGGLGVPGTPQFAQQPQNIVAPEGTPQTLSVVASGGEPITYQWYKNDTLMDGVTGTSIEWQSLQASDAGSYYVVASNSSGGNTSQVARVVVRLPADGGLLARWTFDDGTARDVYGLMDGTLQGGATISSGRLQLNGTDAYLQSLPLPLNVAEKTLVAWVSLANLDQTGGGVITLQTGNAAVFDSVTYAEAPAVPARHWMAGSDGWIRTHDPAGYAETAAPTETVMMAIVYKSDNTISLYRNGQAYGAPYAKNALVSYSAGNATVVMGVRHTPVLAGKMFAGEIDEARLYDRALTVEELGALAGSKLYIGINPQTQFGYVGGSVTFSVTAGGEQPISYQWFKDNEIIPDQTSPDLVLDNVQPTDTADYFVVVANGFGTLTSAVAHLTVYYPVTESLVGHWKLDDFGGLFTTNATGNDMTGTLANFPEDDSQWDYGMIEGALKFEGARRVEIADNPLVRLDHFSVSFWILVNQALAVDSSVISKENFSHCETWGLELRASGQLNFFMFNNGGLIAAVQSSVNLDVGNFHHVVLTYNPVTSTPDIYLDGALVSGTRDTGPSSGPVGYDNGVLSFGRRLGQCTYGQSFTGTLDDVQLYNKVLNPLEAGYLFHNPGEVLGPNVNLPPVITIQPHDQAAFYGNPVTFTVTAEGTSPLYYQWYLNENPIDGATDPSLTIESVQDSDAGAYSVVITNYISGTTSRVVRLMARNPADNGLLARWTFDDGTPRDVFGLMDGILEGGATITDGRLDLDGIGGYARTAPLPVNVTEKTLMAWVRLNTLDQGGGGVMTLQTGNGYSFDSIVYAEQQARKWMSGSEMWNRTLGVGGSDETASPTDTVFMAIVYKSDNSITIYRNGQPYGSAYTQGMLLNQSAGDAVVLFGLRHEPPGAGKFLAGQLDEARLYDRALSSEEIAAFANHPPRITDSSYDPANQAITLSITGAPGYTYRVQYAETLNPPINWIDFSTNTVPAGGMFSLSHTNIGAPARFYRTVFP